MSVLELLPWLCLAARMKAQPPSPVPSPGAHRLGEPQELAGDNLSAGCQELS